MDFYLSADADCGYLQTQTTARWPTWRIGQQSREQGKLRGVQAPRRTYMWIIRRPNRSPGKKET